MAILPAASSSSSSTASCLLLPCSARLPPLWPVKTQTKVTQPPRPDLDTGTPAPPVAFPPDNFSTAFILNRGDKCFQMTAQRSSAALASRRQHLKIFLSRRKFLKYSSTVNTWRQTDQIVPFFAILFFNWISSYFGNI